MGLFNAMNVSATALTAQQTRIDVIANNIANSETTRTPEGGPFRRSRVVLRSIQDRPTFKSAFLPEALEPSVGKGVRVIKLQKDETPNRLVYNPGHPDANTKGYVEMPNVNIITEMVNLIEASRAYEANVTLMTSAKHMYARSLDIGVR